MSALMGFTVAKALAGEDLSDTCRDAVRSGSIGALFSLSSAFGFGALAGFTAYRLGTVLAERHEKAISACLAIDEHAYGLLVNEICDGNLPVRRLLEAASPSFRYLDGAPTLDARMGFLASDFNTLSGACRTLQGGASGLHEFAPALRTGRLTLPDDHPILSDWYRGAALAGEH